MGASVILGDPIIQGLGIPLMAGEIATRLISRMAVAVLYFMVYSRGLNTVKEPLPETSSSETEGTKSS